MAVPKKSLKKKTYVKKKPSRKVGSSLNRLKWLVAACVFVGLGVWFGISFKDGIKYFFSAERKKAVEKSVFDVRNVEVMRRHDQLLFGLDVSQYQGHIDWEQVDRVHGEFPLEFVFIRATMGNNGRDTGFQTNWRSARANNFIRGAYHYYRPNENSVEQAQNFIENVKLVEGDFPPVLDIEELPKKQSIDSLLLGISRWMDLVEKHYQVRPILYSGEHYFVKHLQERFPNHVVWIANYNFFVENIKPEWHFWQFTEKGVVPGIGSNVDLNIYNGSRSEIRKLLIR